MKTSIFGACLLISPFTLHAQMNVADNVTSPIVAASDATLKTFSGNPTMSSSWIDASMSANGDGCYLTTHAVDSAVSGIPDTLRHVRTCGDFAAPYATKVWVKNTCQRNASSYCVNQTSGSHAFTSLASGLNDVVNLWFTSIYHAGGNDRLAFIHEENAGMTGFNQPGYGWEGRTRIGLAYSSDAGQTWRYLGRIAMPYGDPTLFNMQGAPYYVYNGDFYVWYRDKSSTSEGMAVSRARVASVLAAARLGHIGSNLWQKWTSTGWNTNTSAEPLFPSPAVQEIIHSQAAHSADGNYYATATIMTGSAWGTPATHVALYTIDPATLAWTKKMDLVSEQTSAFDPGSAASGYQYASIVDPAGRANGEVGASFYVYSAKNRNNTPPYPQALYQWQVNTTVPADFYKESRGFPVGTQGQNQWNYAAVYSGSYMNWNGGGYWWQPTDIYNRIYNGGMSTGANDGFMLIWTAPRSGTVTVRQTVRSAQPTPACGDGVDFAFQKNSTVQFSGHVNWNDTLGHGSLLSLPVSAGDHFYFYGTKGGNHYCDNLFWDPSISYN